MSRSDRRRRGGGLRPAAGAAALAALVLAASAEVAAAHTQLVSAAASPTTITLRFATPVDARLTDVDALAVAGRVVELGRPRHPAGDRTIITVPVRGGLRNGRHFVTWSTANDDGHAVSGVFDFRAGGAPAAREPAVVRRPSAPAAPAATAGALSVARVAQDAALVIAFGLVVFLRFVWSRVAAGGAGGRSRRQARVAGVRSAVTSRLEGMLAAAAAVGAASAAAAVLLQSAVVARSLPWDGAAVATLPVVLSSRAGAWWSVAGLAWLGVLAAGRRPGGLTLAALAVLLVAAVPLRGHGADGPLASAVILHVAAAGAWIGGLVALLVTARGAEQLAVRERLPFFASVVERFGAVALPCAAAVLATGLVQAIGSLEAPAQLATTGYGRLVAVKLFLFAELIVLAARSRRWLVARLRRPDGSRAAATLRTAIGLELALAALALGTAGVLAGTAPPG